MQHNLRTSAVYMLAIVCIALWMLVLELLKARRLATFEGVWPEMFAALAAGFAIYLTVLLLVGLLLTRMLTRFVRTRCAGERPLLSVALAGVVTWSVVLFCQGEVNAGYTLAALFSFPLLALSVWVVERVSAFSAFACLVSLACVLLFSFYGLSRESRSREVPPISFPATEPLTLFIVADALRADVCSTYGGPVPTPNLDHLAEQGLIFRHAVAPAPWTLPSMYSIAQGGFHPLPPDGVPRGDAGNWLPGMEHGSVALLGNWLLGGADGFAASFERTGKVTVLNSLQAEHEGPMPLTPFLQQALYKTGLLHEPERPLDTSRVLLRSLRRALVARSGGGALYLHLMDPHDPYAPPNAFTPEHLHGKVFSPSPAKDWGSKQLDAERRIRLMPEEQAEARSLYEAEVRYVDACLGMVLEACRDAEEKDSSIRLRVVFTADHGEEFWEHGGYYHGHTLYQEQLHVPLIVSGAGIARGEVHETVSMTALIPALRALNGSGDGGPLGETLRSGAPPAASAVFAYGTVPIASVHHDCAVIDGHYKLILHRDGITKELYDLRVDPHEQHNLVHEEPERVTALSILLETWRARTPLRERGDETKEAVERLEALGYL